MGIVLAGDTGARGGEEMAEVEAPAAVEPPLRGAGNAAPGRKTPAVGSFSPDS